jgi:division protein CdvB (Snf7/Vps24/ESCRT-III family)
MPDETAQLARLMKVVEALLAELERQGVLETMADLGLQPMELAKVAIKAADGDVVPLRRGLPRWP